MTKAHPCLEGALAAAKGKLTEKEINELLGEITSRVERRVAKGDINAATADGLVFDEANQLIRDFDIGQAIAKRQAIVNLRARKLREAQLESFGTDGYEGLKSLLIGSNKNKATARLSVANKQTSNRQMLVGRLVSDLRKGDLTEAAQSGIDKEVALELEQLGREGGQPGITGNNQAMQLAQIYAGVSESARLLQNSRGAFIGKLPGYVTAQTHDADKLRLAAGREFAPGSEAQFHAWVSEIAPRLDEKKTFGAADPAEFLQSVYEGLITGIHFPREVPTEKAAGFKGFANLAKKASAERVLYFKSAADWLAYNGKFGVHRGDNFLLPSMVENLERAGDNAGLMEVFGTSPEAALDETRTQLKKKLRSSNPEGARKVGDRSIDNMFAEVSGRVRRADNITLANLSTGIRIWQSTSKLGGSTLSSFADIATQAAEMKHHGKSFLSSLGEAVSSRMEGASAKDKAEFYDILGVGYEGQIGYAMSRFDSSDNFTGAMSSLQSLFFKLNLQHWWTDGGKVSMAKMVSREMAMRAESVHADLPARYRDLLGNYGIGDKDWEQLRTLGKELEDGRTYITPDLVREIPDDAVDIAIRDRLSALNSISNAAQRQRAKISARDTYRSELEQKLRIFYSDSIDAGIVTPDAGTRALLHQGQNRGTVPGELIRLITQFKSYPISFVQRRLGRTLGAASEIGLWNSLKANGMNSEVAGLASLIVTTTMMGYGAMVAKDLAKGRTPRDPTQAATMLAAVTQGGGFGIYGDFLFGNTSRFGSSLISNLAGPTLSSLDQLDTIRKSLLTGEPGEGFETAVRFAKSNAPFLNLFYVRQVLDYAILYDVQEALSPGSLRLMQQRVERENAQTFMYPPSANRLRPFTGGGP